MECNQLLRSQCYTYISYEDLSTSPFIDHEHNNFCFETLFLALVLVLQESSFHHSIFLVVIGRHRHIGKMKVKESFNMITR